MIRIEHLEKHFLTKDANIHAVNDVTLEIGDGEIYGIMGYSGAGKSTLVRCINFLEIPDSGSIEISGFGKIVSEGGGLFLEKDGSRAPLSEKDLRKLRRSIGMIFQHFNLLDRSTVFDNIAYPLKYSGRSKAEIEERVDELLGLVDLKDKKKAYPSQLSGGQKQRVAIARALANSPDILLSDEATSALDPDATESILQLLKELNKKLGLTIVLITHEMAVIKSIAGKVAVMEDGKVVEEGEVYDIFSDPKQRITKKFVGTSSGLEKIEKLIENGTVLPADSDTEKLVKLTFTKDSVGEAIISKVSRNWSVDVNLVLANVDVVGENALGGIIAKISGSAENVKGALEYMSSCGVNTEVIANGGEV
ncbi:MAG: ATP-binding cassette domain-containing protein [Firmicutes bacterium]|nr:ATP-binding cassette domain-containing protein [Bacillota bacterium]